MLTSRHLGPITNDYTEAKLGEVKIDINVDDPVVLTQELIDEVDRMIDELDALRSAALASFTAAMIDDGSTPTEFWQFHHDDVDPASRATNSSRRCTSFGPGSIRRGGSSRSSTSRYVVRKPIRCSSRNSTTTARSRT